MSRRLSLKRVQIAHPWKFYLKPVIFQPLDCAAKSADSPSRKWAPVMSSAGNLDFNQQIMSENEMKKAGDKIYSILQKAGATFQEGYFILESVRVVINIYHRKDVEEKVRNPNPPTP